MAGAERTEVATYTPTPGVSNRPTDERRAHGSWAEPQGGQKSRQPVIDLAVDAIGRLLVQNKISSAQEQAARQYQQLRAAYLAEFPDIGGYKSCLAGGTPGYDDGDGNAAVIAEYRRMEGRLNLMQRRELLWVCDMGNRPTNLVLLRKALDILGGC